MPLLCMLGIEHNAYVQYIGILVISKGGEQMISYAPMWETMSKKGATTYTLRFKGGISGATVQRIQHNESISTNTIDALCKILKCRVDEVIEFIDDEPEK